METHQYHRLHQFETELRNRSGSNKNGELVDSQSTSRITATVISTVPSGCPAKVRTIPQMTAAVVVISEIVTPPSLVYDAGQDADDAASTS